MLISVKEALASLAQERGQAPASGWPSGAPVRDFLRSPAAARIARFAQREDLFCFHFEQRAALPLPEAWIAPGCESDAEVQGWQDGKLIERKYQSFRHDLLIGSFHPGHRGKWTTHELCHALIGYAWRPDASALFHACAARLAELLPVILYYFFDEVRLARCAEHAGGGALYRQHCPACEDAAAFRPVDPVLDRALIEDGLRYLDRELAAVARTRRTGCPAAHRHGSLDLCGDGLRYAHAHRLRLQSRAFAIWAELFDGPCSGRVPDLDALQDRVERLVSAMLGQAPWTSRPGTSRAHWMRQDLAMRLLVVHAETDGEAAAQLLAIVEGLSDQQVPLAQVRVRYDALAEEYVLPAGDVIWALGYPSEGHDGVYAPQVQEGLRSCAPLTMKLLEGAGVQPTAAFVAADVPARAPIGDRFADWLEATWPGPAAELARFEAAVVGARSDSTAAALRAEAARPIALRPARGIRVLRAQRDPIALAESVEQGTAVAHVLDGRLTLAGDHAPCGLIVARDARGDLLLVGVDDTTAAALQRGDVGILPESEYRGLAELGVLIPERWPLDVLKRVHG